MTVAYIDFETYYDRDYSLRKMTTVEYLKDARFELVGAAVALDDEPTRWLWWDELPAFFADLKARMARKEPVQMVSHNIKFDGAVAAWHCDFVPSLYVDTLGMARALLAHKLQRLSLDSVAQHLSLGAKGNALAAALGWHRNAIRAQMAAAYSAYATLDNDLCRGIFKVLRSEMPRQEFMICDMIIRMFTQPQLTLDNGVLVPHLAAVRRNKQTLLDRLGLADNSTLMSNDKFALALQALGVDPPTKISARTNKEAFAFAKTDQAFKELLDHEDENVQALVAARLGHKTTIEETRTERFIQIGLLYPKWPERVPLMPVPLRYSGGHTHRLSGEDKLNMQNLSKVIPGEPQSGALRRSLVAPKGYVIVSIDLSQIEARVVAWLAGQQDMVDLFARGEDPYVYMAIKIGALSPDEPRDTPTWKKARQLGKVLVLACGFGMGGEKFLPSARGYNVILTLDEAQKAVRGYRAANPMIVQLWKTLGDALAAMAYRVTPYGITRQSECMALPHGYEYYFDGDNAVRLTLPSDLELKYENLRHQQDGMWFEYSGRKSYIYGGKATENWVQAFARCIIMDAAIRIRKQTGFRIALQVHDENVFVVPEKHAEAFRQEAARLTMIRPSYALDLPIACDAKMGHTYAEAH